MSITNVILYKQDGEVFDSFTVGHDLYHSTLKKTFTISKILDDEYGNVALFFKEIKDSVYYKGFPYRVEIGEEFCE